MKKILVGVCLVVGLLVFGSGTEKTSAQAEAIAIGALFQQAENLADRLTANARSLIEQGNNALAEQQALLAGLLRSTIEQARKAYEKSLTETINQAADLEKDAFAQLRRTIEQAEGFEKKTVEDMEMLIRQGHSAANQLLSNMPFVYKYPVLEGMRTLDVLSAIDESPKDIEMLGFWLFDPELKQKPEIKIVAPGVNETVPAGNVTVWFDRIQIQLPDQIKQKIQFANTPCGPRKTFQVQTKVFYKKTRGYWPARWTENASWDHTANALSGSTWFEVKIGIDGKRTKSVTSKAPFAVVKQGIQWGCEQDVNQTVQYTAEQGRPIVGQPQCQFDVRGNFENSSSCSAKAVGDTATASGYVRGANKVGRTVLGVEIKNCPGGGNGDLRLWGEYELKNPETNPFQNEVISSTLMTGKNKVQVTLPVEGGLVLDKVRVSIHRSMGKNVCPTAHDQVEILVPKLGSGEGNTVQTVMQTSKYGGFRVTVDKAQLTVERLF